MVVSISTPTQNVADSSDDTLLLPSVEDRCAPPTYEEASEAELASEVDNEDAASCDSGVSPPPKVLNVNEAYERWRHSLSGDRETARENLFTAVEVFARRLTQMGSPALNDAPKNGPTEISQDAGMRVLDALDAGKYIPGKAKFSTWVHSIVVNRIIDEGRRQHRRDGHEEPLPDNTNNRGVAAAHTYAGSRNGEEGSKPEGTDHLRAYEEVLQREFVQESEDRLIAQIDGQTAQQRYERAYFRMSLQHRKIADALLDHKTAKEIGETFGKDSKWASNRISDVRLELGAKLEYFETVVHTCRLGEAVSEMQPDTSYVGDCGDFRPLPKKCRCRRELTRGETSKKVADGEVQRVVRRALKADGKFEAKPVWHQVWSKSFGRVARVGLTSSAHIERAAAGNRANHSDIEYAHELTLRFRSESIRVVPADEYDRIEREETGFVTASKSASALAIELEAWETLARQPAKPAEKFRNAPAGSDARLRELWVLLEVAASTSNTDDSWDEMQQRWRKVLHDPPVWEASDSAPPPREPQSDGWFSAYKQSYNERMLAEFHQGARPQTLVVPPAPETGELAGVAA